MVFLGLWHDHVAIAGPAEAAQRWHRCDLLDGLRWYFVTFVLDLAEVHLEFSMVVYGTIVYIILDFALGPGCHGVHCTGEANYIIFLQEIVDIGQRLGATLIGNVIVDVHLDEGVGLFAQLWVLAPGITVSIVLLSLITFYTYGTGNFMQDLRLFRMSESVVPFAQLLLQEVIQRHTGPCLECFPEV